MATAKIEQPPVTENRGLRFPKLAVHQAVYTQSMKPLYKYSPPTTKLDPLTTYIQDYTSKKGDRSRPIRPHGTRMEPGKFEAEQTYTADYKPWDLAPRQTLSPRSNYVPPSATFEAETNYTADYIAHQIAPSENRKAKKIAVSSEPLQPLQTATEHRDNFVTHSLPSRYSREQQLWQPTKAKLDDQSNYRRDFTPKTLQKNQSCRPDPKPYLSESPLAKDTTHRDDYKLWPVSPRQRREYKAYTKPDGEFNSSTTTGTDYTHKPMERILMHRPTEKQRTSGTFESKTNYKEEYQAWPLQDIHRGTKKYEYTAPEMPFTAEPSYRQDYVAYPGSPRTESMKPAYSMQLSDKPFENTTGYRQDYIMHTIPNKYRRQIETWKPNEAPLDDSTNYMIDYVPKELSKQVTYKPTERMMKSNAKFLDGTTHREDYITWPVKPPKLHQLESYRQPEGNMDHNTTTRLDYNVKQIVKVNAIRPDAGKLETGVFDGTTNYSTDFVLHNVEPRKQRAKAKYIPSDIKFEGLPTYRRDYIAYGDSPRQPSMKPAFAATGSNIPLEDLTEYRDSYVGFEMEPCPSWMIQSGVCSDYTLVEEDDKGHSFYEKQSQQTATA